MSAAPEPPPPYVVHAIAQGLRVELTLNGWPVFSNQGPRANGVQTIVNPWIVEGKNELEATVALEPGDPPPKSRVFHALLVRGVPGKPPSDGELVFSYRFDPIASPLSDDGEPTRVFADEFRLQRAFGTWAWETARLYANQDRPEVVAVVARLHRAVAAGDVDGLGGLLTLKIEEIARALGRPGREMIEEVRESFARAFADGSPRPAPFEPDRLVMRSAAKGRLVSVFAPDGRAPVRLLTERREIAVDVALSCVAGSFQIVR